MTPAVLPVPVAPTQPRGRLGAPRPGQAPVNASQEKTRLDFRGK